MIGITEPRRVAAISTARRIATELNQAGPTLEDAELTETPTKKRKRSDPTKHVSYQVRYDSTVDAYTRIKLMYARISFANSPS